MQAQPVRHLILALAPLVFELPWWAILWCLVFWGWALARDANRLPTLSKAIRVLLFSIGVTLVLLFAGMRFDGGDFIALLAVMAGIKPLEVRGHRDSMVTVFLAYFLVIASLFVFENLSMTAYLFVSVWVTTAVLIHVNTPTGAFGRQIRLSARLVLWAVPLTMLFFFLFPRLPGSFIGAPWSRQSTSGFTNVMRMGDVSQIAVTNTPVFSVFFNASPPSPAQRYWRGIVFQSFDGQAWTPISHPSIRQRIVSGENFVRYKVILEPHGHRNLFALDLPVSVTTMATPMQDHTLMARYPIRKQLTYDATSVLDYRQGLDEHPEKICLQLPPNSNPRTLALGRQLADTHADPRAVVSAGLDFLKNNGFAYSLRPERLGKNAVDDFLFVTRNGFCEHFASAFTVLMRSAGIPARMVGGYQGGRWNALGHFLTVRQADAHVWCEVWLKEDGWVRVDPTVEVAPHRIDQGIDGFFDGLPWLANSDRSSVLRRWVDYLRQSWETINIRWDMWIMGFSAEDQAALFKNMWLRGKWLLLSGAVIGLMAAVFLAGQWQRRRQPKTIASKARVVFNRFLRKMSRVGLEKPPYQGAWAYSRSVIRRYPRMEKEIDDIVGHYLALRYGREPDEENLKALRVLVRRFRPVVGEW